MLLNEKLKYLRAKNGLTQQQLADALGMGQSTIGMIESGKREVSFDVLEKIANFFKVSTDFLLFGFEKTKVTNLVEAARFGRDIKQFSKDTGVEEDCLKRLCKGEISGPPSPEIIKQIMDNPDSQILSDYSELMWAAGHIDHKTMLERKLEQSKNSSINTPVDSQNKYKYIDSLPPEAKKEIDSFIDYIVSKYNKS